MSWEAHFEEGRALGRSGDMEGAIAAFRRAITAAPDEPHPHYDLGFTLYHMGHVEEAVAELRKTNELAEGFFMVQTELAIYEAVLDGTLSKEAGDKFRTLFTAGDIPLPFGVPEELRDKLDTMVRELMALAPDFALTHFHFAKHAKEPVEKRRASVERCLALGPDDTTKIRATQMLSNFYEDEDPLKAREILRSVVEEFPHHPQNAMTKHLLQQGSAPAESDSPHGE